MKSISQGNAYLELTRYNSMQIMEINAFLCPKDLIILLEDF